jgi:hypothetical protein
MRHRFFRRLRPARHGIVFQIDARRYDQPVIGQLLATGENDFLLVAVDLAGAVGDDRDAVLLQRAVAVGDGG